MTTQDRELKQWQRKLDRRARKNRNRPERHQTKMELRAMRIPGAVGS